ncbi:MAG: GNAT family N-acetyltransferase [Clostridia bacterium]|nr:GNAT family N-acetyltransferase [Clostridia bacterium]
MDIIIKKMETDDEIRGKGFVHYTSWQQAYRGIVDQGYLDSMSLQKCEEIAYRWLDNILVAKDGEDVVGFAGYRKYRDDELTGTGEVYAIYVLQQYWGKGVGHMLMQAALDMIKEYPAVAVWVLKDNARAIRFYEKLGFRPDGREETLTLGAPVTEMRMILKRSAAFLIT